MAVHSVQITPDGTAHESRPGTLESSLQPPQSTTEQRSSVRAMDSSERSGRVVIKDGVTTFEQYGPMRATTALTAGDALDRGRDQTGYPQTRNQLTLDSIVDYHGETRVRELVAMKILEPDPAGGFRWSAQPDAQSSQTQQQQTEPTARLSDGAENFMSAAAERLGPTTMYATMLAVLEGREVRNIGEIASRLQKEPEAITQNIEKLKTEFTTVAQRGLGMDEQTWADFVETTWERHPNEMHDATVKFVDNGQLGPLRALAAKFTASGAAYDDDSLLSAEVPEGARVWRNPDTRQIMVSYKGRTNTLRGLIASGEARVSKRK
jgi:hypothetical protein